MRRFIFGLSVILSAAFIFLFSLNVDAVQETDTSATRTAIAITREPILGTPATPSSIELTAAVAYQKYEARLATLYHQPNEILEITASAIVAWATQQTIDLTVTPIKSSTPSPTATELPCILYFDKIPNAHITNEVARSLRGITGQGSLDVYDLELIMPANCRPETHFLSINIEIRLRVTDTSDKSLIPIIEDLLAYLQNSQLTGDGRSLRLIMEFNVLEKFCQLRRIDTSFINAQLAYKKGLRGQKLIEALGGLIDTDKDVSGYCPLMAY